MRKINWVQLRAKLKEAILALPHFFKNPVQGMRTLPDWDWSTMLLLQTSFSAACAVLGNLLERDLLGVFTGLVLAPIAAVVVTAVGTGFFYYTFLFFFKREVPFRQIYLHVLFAAIPLQITSVVTPLIPPMILIGVASSLFLLFIGFVENFSIERQKAQKLLIAIGVIYTLFWGFQLFNSTSKHERMRLKATPESLDILEKELKFDD